MAAAAVTAHAVWIPSGHLRKCHSILVQLPCLYLKCASPHLSWCESCRMTDKNPDIQSGLTTHPLNFSLSCRWEPKATQIEWRGLVKLLGALGEKIYWKLIIFLDCSYGRDWLIYLFKHMKTNISIFLGRRHDGKRFLDCWLINFEFKVCIYAWDNLYIITNLPHQILPLIFLPHLPTIYW